MTASFVVYVDESGDEGFKFLESESGSSRWFVLSAVVFRKSNARAPIAILEDVRATLKKDRNKPLHFRDLKHEQRVVFVNRIAQERLRLVSVLVCKPLIGSPEEYEANKFMLYRYVTRLLLERVSWLCRDNYRTGDGDGDAELVFSNRSAMSYEDMRNYLRKLRASGDRAEISIDWDIIHPDRIRAVNHEKLAGLQVADAVASSMFFACNCNPYGNVESRYAQTLARSIYRGSNRSLFGYGLKFWPDIATCKKIMPHVAAFEEL